MQTQGPAMRGVEEPGDPVQHFVAMIDENLAGRRVLARHANGTEPEPATLAQLPSMQRVQEALVRLRGRPDVIVEALDRATGLILAPLIEQLASNADAHVASWPAANHLVEAVAHLLDAFETAVPPPPPVD